MKFKALVKLSNEYTLLDFNNVKMLRGHTAALIILENNAQPSVEDMATLSKSLATLKGTIIYDVPMISS